MKQKFPGRKQVAQSEPLHISGKAQKKQSTISQSLPNVHQVDISSVKQTCSPGVSVDWCCPGGAPPPHPGLQTHPDREHPLVMGGLHQHQLHLSLIIWFLPFSAPPLPPTPLCSAVAPHCGKRCVQVQS